MGPSWRIAQPFCLALGPQINSVEPVWYVSARVCSGEDKIFFSQGSFETNYPDLSTWTGTIPNAPRACFVTFGPNLSYYASAPGHGSTWAGIPSDLSDKIQKAFDTPNCVSLGMAGAWFVMWPDGYYSWKFYGAYGGLDNILGMAEPRSVSYLAISPYNDQQYFVAFRDRTVKYNFTGAPEWLPQMQDVFSEWQTEIQQKQSYSQYQPYNTASTLHQQWNQHPQLPGIPGSPLPLYPRFLDPSTANLSHGRAPSIMSTASSSKRRSFFSRKFSSKSVSEAVSAKQVYTVPTEGTQTCSVM
ncbi:hypothetical protein K504DRAFT_467744 [Pleomassaria siparia CBS 279.74]|uniref:Uncharacterized protein n=1 Tax=Pleomassaria siparia CBS 279.74 TaxID=1314801 RepID=A0A6G1KAZ6_9PLEO|nr:hypothetical protein K504DRAFT_467744 [Pleomassaria siparia CBS 279.74]